MFKKKLLLAAILTAPLFTMTSCQGTIRVTLDTGIGLFTNGETCRTITITKGSSLFATLGEEIPFTGGVGEGGEEERMHPIYWTKGNRSIVHWNDGINSSMTLHAHYFSTVQDARDSALGKIGAAYMDACARQPEAIEKLTTAYEAAAKHVANASSEGAALGMGKVGGSEMDAGARQPEAITKIATAAEYYFVTLEASERTLSNNLGVGVGKVGGSAMDACARQPEAIEKEKGLATASSLFMEAVKTLPSYCGIGFGKFGSSFMDACARQPEAIEKFIEKAPTIFDGLRKTKNSMQAYNIGKSASSWADAAARQPEAINKLFDELVKNINDILKS